MILAVLVLVLVLVLVRVPTCGAPGMSINTCTVVEPASTAGRASPARGAGSQSTFLRASHIV